TVLVLGGTRDFFSNGIHLNVIDAADDPGAESWANINAMDDLVEAVLSTTDRLVVSALGGNAAAGGAMLALAADEVWCRSGVVLNPHYRLMGLYGSEYWTYTLPRRVGAEAADRLTQEALPVSASAGLRLGLVDRLVECCPQDFPGEVTRSAVRLAKFSGMQERIAAKKQTRERDESVRPLSLYREAELSVMLRTFSDPDAPYHALRRAFVRKQPPAKTPSHLVRAGATGR
ncbi:enoyl-CoA hydratase-related protein, partial [Streptomyces sp. NPDC056512]